MKVETSKSPLVWLAANQIKAGQVYISESGHYYMGTYESSFQNLGTVGVINLENGSYTGPDNLACSFKVRPVQAVLKVTL